jgi:hypothetical protein
VVTAHTRLSLQVRQPLLDFCLFFMLLWLPHYSLMPLVTNRSRLSTV